MGGLEVPGSRIVRTQLRSTTSADVPDGKALSRCLRVELACNSALLKLQQRVLNFDRLAGELGGGALGQLKSASIPWAQLGQLLFLPHPFGLQTLNSVFRLLERLLLLKVRLMRL